MWVICDLFFSLVCLFQITNNPKEINYWDFSSRILETDCLPWIARIASASKGATESWTILGLSLEVADKGIVFKTTTCSNTDSLIYLLADFENKPWEAKANTRRAIKLNHIINHYLHVPLID